MPPPREDDEPVHRMTAESLLVNIRVVIAIALIVASGAWSINFWLVMDHRNLAHHAGAMGRGEVVAGIQEVKAGIARLSSGQLEINITLARMEGPHKRRFEGSFDRGP